MYTLFIWSALFVWLAVVLAALRLLRLPLPKGLWPAYCAVPFALFGARLLNVVLHGRRLKGSSMQALPLPSTVASYLGAGAALILMKAAPARAALFRRARPGLRLSIAGSRASAAYLPGAASAS